MDRAPATYAALDLGTNNCRLLIARPVDGSFRVIDSFSRIVRLGEGLGTLQAFHSAAISRTLEALAACREKLDLHSVTRMRLVATQACRSAQNARDFCTRVRDELGLTLEVISNQHEAELASIGCVSLIAPHTESVVLFDIGGGSTEIIWLEPCAMDSGPPEAHIRDWISLPVGVVSLAERHGGLHVTPELFKDMVQECLALVEGFGSHAALKAHTEPMHLIGTSGTVTTLAGVFLGLARYDRRRVDGLWLQSAQIEKTIAALLAMSYEARCANGCIGKERADLVLAGCAILQAILMCFPPLALRVADRGLREGILIQLMRQDRIWGRR